MVRSIAVAENDPLVEVSLSTVVAYAAFIAAEHYLEVSGVMATVGAGIAAYHVGVEQHWWQGPTACAGGTIPSSFAEMQRMMSTPIVPCDKPAWTLLGISMAGYNAVFSLLFGAGVILLTSRSEAAGRRDTADIYYRRGLAYEKQDDYEKAIADYEKASRLDPNYTRFAETGLLAAVLTGSGHRHFADQLIHLVVDTHRVAGAAVYRVAEVRLGNRVDQLLERHFELLFPRRLLTREQRCLLGKEAAGGRCGPAGDR